MSKIRIQSFFDPVTHTVTYVVADVASGLAAVIDPVLDYDPASGVISDTQINRVIAFLDREGLNLEWILETHVHADHLSAAHLLRQRRGGSIGIGEHIRRVQSTFKGRFNLPDDFPCDGSQFDHLLADGEVITVGHVDITVLHTPGHTPACVSYHIEDAVFVGDTLFMPDYGTARTDFPDGSAKTLHRSISKLLALPPSTRMFVGHDYLPEGREDYAWETTVMEQKRSNIHVHDGVSATDFIQQRESRDATLGAPRLLLPALQVNIRAGQLPPAESNGVRYLKLPLSGLDV
ncbi:MBL fold metallo-hydrolase [Aestuariibacter halophilus]|uniref:MBL fold metallo-hydrolase n=1 Tax=Fluctibacter halophilus TaxID=226011 RepID=A0ABS8GBJ7_9ALTE|nr:MBL fold metallo-hydrolase [Aestuariibacter halophilus]MCC2617922.1 MBL fold metallo-hydrolase [Aestuariibacter halophilus]